MSSPLDIAEECIALLEKSAAEGDRLDAENLKLKSDLRALEVRNAELLRKQASSVPPSLNPALVYKLATVMEEENLLADGYTAEKLASLLQAEPDKLLDLTFRLLAPAAPQGRATKAASAVKESSEKGKIVMFEGRRVVDLDGWLNVLK